MAVTIADIQHRALTGPIMDEEDFNLKFSQRLRRLVKEYEIEWPKEQILPDGETADKIFRAAIEMICQNGIYHMDTKRVVHFTRDEVIETAHTRERQWSLGDGKDAVLFRERTPESTFAPVIVGFPGVVTEDMFVPITLSHAIEPTCQGIQPAIMQGAWGMQNKSGTPGELYTVLAESEYNRIVARLAGKPGMPFMEPDSATTPFATIASFYLRGYTATGCHMPTHVLGDLKLTWERLNLAAFAQLSGIPTWNGTSSLLGGFARNAAEWAVAHVGGLLGILSYTHGRQWVGGVSDIRGQWSPRENLRAGAAAYLATERNIHVPIGIHTEGNAGGCTHMYFFEEAAQILTYTSSGVEWFWGASPSKGVVPNSSSGMETRMLGETAMAVAGISSDRTNEILNGILAKYESQLKDPPKGKLFAECYDVETLKPTDEHLKVYAEAKEELNKVGINYKY